MPDEPAAPAADNQPIEQPAAQPAPADAPAPKKFNFKQSETQTLVMVRDHQNAVFSAVLSQFAIERLGYPVTQNTQFALNPELTEVSISELTPAEGGEIQTPPAPTAEPPTPDNSSPVVSSEGGQTADPAA